MANWWEAGGASGCVAAYQAVGAANLAASYVNLANPGTNNASVTSGFAAPEWDAVSGWVNDHDPMIQSLDVGTIVPGLDYTMFIDVADTPDPDNVIGGRIAGAAGGGNEFSILPNLGFGIGSDYVNGNQAASSFPGLSSAVYCLAGKKGYRNGVFLVEVAAGGLAPTGVATIGQVGGFRLPGRIRSFALYNNTHDDTTVAAVSAAMAALPAASTHPFALQVAAHAAYGITA